VVVVVGLVVVLMMKNQYLAGFVVQTLSGPM
jgi:hypothetical protein